MSRTADNELSPVLHRHVVAIDTNAPDTAADRAQQRLHATLARRKSTHARRRSGVLALAATACAAFAIALLPMLFDNGGLAFADVQRHFRQFSTLAVHMQQFHRDQPLQASDILVDAEGRVRVDVGTQLSVIVDPAAEAVLTLLHGPRRAMRTPLAPGEVTPANDALDWLDEIRAFQGEATRLPEPRTIDGQSVHGWQLDTAGGPMVLWATEDGLPLAMDYNAGALRLAFSFAFDVPVDPQRFSLQPPAGYASAQPDQQ